jgi:TRAP-type C4-dicarboxylate transport system permease large subunit
VAGLRAEPVIKALVPFFLALVAMLFVVTFIPQLSMWLPDVLGLLAE